jgi:hypothetical protein
MFSPEMASGIQNYKSWGVERVGVKPRETIARASLTANRKPSQKKAETAKKFFFV